MKHLRVKLASLVLLFALVSIPTKSLAFVCPNEQSNCTCSLSVDYAGGKAYGVRVNYSSNGSFGNADRGVSCSQGVSTSINGGTQSATFSVSSSPVGSYCTVYLSDTYDSNNRRCNVGFNLVDCPSGQSRNGSSCQGTTSYKQYRCENGSWMEESTPCYADNDPKGSYNEQDKVCKSSSPNKPCVKTRSCGTANGTEQKRCADKQVKKQNFINDGFSSCKRGTEYDGDYCSYGCNDGTCNGDTATYIKYRCESNGSRVQAGSCTSNENINPSYTPNQTVCRSDGAPNATCQAVGASCGGSNLTCGPGSYVDQSDNNQTSCNQTRQWKCSNNGNTVDCSNYNGNCGPVNCAVSRGGYGNCDKSCGGGTQYSYGTITTYPSNGGDACPTNLTQSQSCNTDTCTTDRDCVIDDNFGPWTNCSAECGGGSQSRTKNILKSQAGNGAACGTTYESRQCNTQTCEVNTPKNGSCNESIDWGCSKGYVNNQQTNGNTKTRTCKGTNNGNDASCTRTSVGVTYSCNGVSCQQRFDGGGPYTNSTCNGECSGPPCGNGRVDAGETCDRGTANSDSCSTTQCGSCNGCSKSCQTFTQSDKSKNESARNFQCISKKAYSYRQVLSCVDGYNVGNCNYGQECDSSPNRNASNICKSCPAGGAKSNFRCIGNSIGYDETDNNCGSETKYDACPYQYRCEQPGGGAPVCKCDAMLEVGLNVCDKNSLASCGYDGWKKGNFQTFELYNSSFVLIGSQKDAGYKVKFTNVVAGQTYYVKVTDLSSGREPGLHFLQRDYSTNKIASATGNITVSGKVNTRDMKVVAGNCVTDAKLQFYCANPPCASKVKLVVDAGRDTNGNGQLDNGENTGIPGVINVYKKQGGSWVLYQSSRTLTGGNGCGRDPNDDGNIAPYITSAFVSQGCQGTTIDPISIDGGMQYRVTVSPEMGYQAKSKFTRQGQKANHKFVPLADTASSSLKDTVEFTAPDAENVTVVFGHMGEDKDIALTTKVVNAKGGYYSGDIIQVAYKVVNAGFGKIDRFEVTSAILTGLEFIPGSATTNGKCYNGYRYIPPTRRAWRTKDNNGNIIYDDINSWHDFNNCSLTRSEWEEGSCAVPFFNSMLFTWRSVRPSGGSCITNDPITPYFEKRIKPTDPFPASRDDLFFGAGPASRGPNAQNDEQCYWYPKQGYSIQFGNGGDGSEGQKLSNGEFCEVTLSYRITNDKIGSTIRTRSCANPTDTEKILYGGSNPQFEPVRNNCDELLLPIGLPYTWYRCDSAQGEWETIGTGKYNINGLPYNESAGFASYAHNALVSRLTVMGDLSNPIINTCAKYTSINGVCSLYESFSCNKGILRQPTNQASKAWICDGVYGGSNINCGLYNYYVCNTQGLWSRVGLPDQLTTGGFELYNTNAAANFYPPNKIVYTPAIAPNPNSITCQAALDGVCGNDVSTCLVGTAVGGNGNILCDQQRTWNCQGNQWGVTASCRGNNPSCARCGIDGGCAVGSPTNNNNTNACGQTKTWNCNNPQGTVACTQFNGDCPVCSTTTANSCIKGSVINPTLTNICDQAKTRTCQTAGATNLNNINCSIIDNICVIPAGKCSLSQPYECDKAGSATNINNTSKTRTCPGNPSASCKLYKNITCNNGIWTTGDTNRLVPNYTLYISSKTYSGGTILSIPESETPTAISCAKSAVNGECSTDIKYFCKYGTQTGEDRNAKTWNCKGIAGGNDASCTLYNDFICRGSGNPIDPGYGRRFPLQTEELTRNNQLYNSIVPFNTYGSGEMISASGAVKTLENRQCRLFVASAGICHPTQPYGCSVGVVTNPNYTAEKRQCLPGGGTAVYCSIYHYYTCKQINDQSGSGYWIETGSGNTITNSQYRYPQSNSIYTRPSNSQVSTVSFASGYFVSFRKEAGQALQNPNQLLPNKCHGPINGVCNITAAKTCIKGTLNFTAGNSFWTCDGIYGGDSSPQCRVYDNYICNGNGTWTNLSTYQATPIYTSYDPSVANGYYSTGTKVSVSRHIATPLPAKCSNNTGDAVCGNDYQDQCQNGVLTNPNSSNKTRSCVAPNNTSVNCSMYNEYRCEGASSTWFAGQQNQMKKYQLYQFSTGKYIDGDWVSIEVYKGLPNVSACKHNPVNGVCGTDKITKCNKGLFVRPQGNPDGQWNCQGEYNGTTVSCTAYDEYRCDIGYWTMTSDFKYSTSRDPYIVNSLDGAYAGGQFISVIAGVVPSNNTCQGNISKGICGPTLNTCTSGLYTGNNPSNFTWQCSGINGGPNASCRAYNGYRCIGSGAGSWSPTWSNLSTTGGAGYSLYNMSVINDFYAPDSYVYNYSSDAIPNNLKCKGYSYDGVCSNSVGYTCTVGNMINDSSYYKRRECAGTNGGKTVGCTFVKDYTCDGNNGNWVALSADKLIPGYSLYNTAVATDGYVGGNNVSSRSDTVPDDTTCKENSKAGVCGTSYVGHCTSAASSTNTNYSAETRTCPGSNGGANTACARYHNWYCNEINGNWDKLTSSSLGTANFAIYNTSATTDSYMYGQTVSVSGNIVPNNTTCKQGVVINGLCSTVTPFACVTGVPTNANANKRDCVGQNGGTTSTCNLYGSYTCDGQNATWTTISSNSLTHTGIIFNTSAGYGEYSGGWTVYTTASYGKPSDYYCKKTPPLPNVECRPSLSKLAQCKYGTATGVVNNSQCNQSYLPEGSRADYKVRWKCEASNGFETVSVDCSYNNYDCNVNGVCGTTKNTCAVGTVDPWYNQGCDRDAAWFCNGYGNGSDPYCSKANPACIWDIFQCNGNNATWTPLAQNTTTKTGTDYSYGFDYSDPYSPGVFTGYFVDKEVIFIKDGDPTPNNAACNEINYYTYLCQDDGNFILYNTSKNNPIGGSILYDKNALPSTYPAGSYVYTLSKKVPSWYDNQCDTKDRIMIINPRLDTDKNGTSDCDIWNNTTSSECGLVGSTVNIYDINGILKSSSLVKSSGPYPDRGWIQQYPLYYYKGTKGAVEVYLSGNTSYRIDVIPPTGYEGVATNSHLLGATEMFGSVYYHQNYTNTKLSPLSYTVTTPSKGSLLARTRLVAINNDMEINVIQTGSIKSAYTVGDIITLRYTLTNKGLTSTIPSFETSIIDGMVATGAAIIAGTCPTYTHKLPGSYQYDTISSVDRMNLIYACNSGANASNIYCHKDYINGILTTYNSAGSLYTTNFPGIVYPISTSNLTSWSAGANTRQLPKGIFTSFSSSGPAMPAGASCTITQNYIVTTTPSNNIIQTRSCVIPEASERSSLSLIANNCVSNDFYVVNAGCDVPAAFGKPGNKIPEGDWIRARKDDLITPTEGGTCEGQIRRCNGGVLSGTFTATQCATQCVGPSGNGLNIGESINMYKDATSSYPTCSCKPTSFTCNPQDTYDPDGFFTWSRGVLEDRFSQPMGAEFDEPVCIEDPMCNISCQNEQEALYEINYGLKGNTSLQKTKITDQVHSNTCIFLSSFTGKIANNDVHINFYQNDKTPITGLQNITGSSLSATAGNTKLCGPYVEYIFDKPLLPGAKGSFFYKYELKENIQENPLAGTGDNCVWIYRAENRNSISSGIALNALIDSGDFASRFIQATLTQILPNVSTDRFNVSEQLWRNNKICVPPPVLLCTPFVAVKQNLITAVCGDGMLQVGEQCDDGIIPTSGGYYNHDLNSDKSDPGPVYLADSYGPLQGKSCSTSCEINGGMPQSCYFELPPCNTSSIQSIQEGEIYPFWWNISEASKGKLTTQCVTNADVGKIIYVPGLNEPMCNFGIYNGQSGLKITDSVTGFSLPCFSPNKYISQPIFNVNASPLASDEMKYFRTKEGGNQQYTNTSVAGNSTVNNPLARTDSLGSFREKLDSSQGSFSILMSGFTQGKLGEYRIRLDGVKYEICIGQDVTIGGVTTIIPQPQIEQINQPLCQQNLILTKPYLIQESSSLSTVSNESFDEYFVFIDNMNEKTLTRVYGSGVLTNVTKIGSYIPLLKGQAFVDTILSKYVKLAGSSPTKLYTENFDGLPNVQTNTTLFKQIPNRQIYIYTGVNSVYISQMGLDAMTASTKESVTIIAPNANVFIFKNIDNRNIFVITQKDIGFLGSNLVSDSQKISGILLSSGYVAPQLKNDNVNIRWTDDGRLTIEGILMSNDISTLVNRRRSVVKDWYIQEGYIGVQDYKKQQLARGASVQIVTNVSIFTSPPPLSQELFETLQLSK